MKKLRAITKAKHVVLAAFWVLSVLFFVWLIAYKDELTNLASTSIKSQAGSEIQKSESAYVDSAFNYAKNGLSYEVTFLEFGSKGCSACKRMEGVMSEIRATYPDKVNVVFVNILLPENQRLMKYYGIAVIPTQVLLDKEGEEFFRHTGYISANDLKPHFD